MNAVLSWSKIRPEMQSFPELFANRWAAERPNRWPSLIHQVLSVTQSAVPPTPTYSKTQSPTAALCDEGEAGVSLSDRGSTWSPETAGYITIGAVQRRYLPPYLMDVRLDGLCLCFQESWSGHSLTHQTFSHAESPSSCWVIRTLPYISGRGLIEIWPKERYMHACTYILDGHGMSQIYRLWVLTSSTSGNTSDAWKIWNSQISSSPPL